MRIQLHGLIQLVNVCYIHSQYGNWSICPTPSHCIIESTSGRPMNVT